ncbi:hypothetical protein COY17_03980 [Candidatus Saccharibacteria bacterium CG_4_10_14_0_2_um_filter_52_9]|nr:MAG: hypothetical protein COY17_03980 [Candidatus Saccharibacteria bacterium CG_4_10_14_0_2_um_filter_52_9]
MELKGNGISVQVNPAEQSDEWLISAAQEIAEAAQVRGLELPLAAAAVAVEATTHPETLDEVRESLYGQLNTAYLAYDTLTQKLDDGRKTKDRVSIGSETEITIEFETWLTDEKVAYVQAAMEADPELRFTLVATPNVELEKGEVERLAKTFGEQQPYETSVYENLYKKYSPQELAGTDPSNGNDVMFSLIPSKFDEALTGTVVKQQAKLAEMQKANPSLKVPSVLEAVTYWQTLRASGDTLSDSEAFYKTYIRHFNLDAKRFGGWSGVPDSVVASTMAGRA